MIKQVRVIVAVSGLLISMHAVSSVPTRKLSIAIKEHATAKNDALDTMYNDAHACGMINDEVEKTTSTEEFIQNMGCAAYAKWVALQKYVAACWACVLEKGTAWAHYGSALLHAEG